MTTATSGPTTYPMFIPDKHVHLARWIDRSESLRVKGAVCNVEGCRLCAGERVKLISFEHANGVGGQWYRVSSLDVPSKGTFVVHESELVLGELDSHGRIVITGDSHEDRETKQGCSVSYPAGEGDD